MTNATPPPTEADDTQPAWALDITRAHAIDSAGWIVECADFRSEVGTEFSVTAYGTAAGSSRPIVVIETDLAQGVRVRVNGVEYAPAQRANPVKGDAMKHAEEPRDDAAHAKARGTR